MCRQCEFSGTLASEEAEACFVLPLREAVAHFARRNREDPRRRQRWGSSDNGNAHMGIGISADLFGVGFLPLLGEPGR
jgi:hypothetical protein